MSSENFIIDVSAESFETDVLENSARVPVLVDFWAPWCGPCKTLMPLLSRLADEYQGKFLLAKVNIDEQQALAVQFGVRSVPTVKLFRHGQVIDEFAGALPESQIRPFIDAHIERESDRQLPAILELFRNGDHAAALAQLQPLRESEPGNLKLVELELQMLIESGQLERAAEMLHGLPADQRQEPAIQTLASTLTLKQEVSNAPREEELRQRLEQNPDDSEARYQLAMQKTANGDFEDALEGLLELLRRDRAYGDEAARKGMLMVFELLGPDDELVARYRRKMFAALH